MFKRKKSRLVLVPDKRSWKERHRIDPRKRDRTGYKRPDAGKRPKTHSGATSRGRYRSNNQRTGIATNNQRMKREGAFIMEEEQEPVEVPGRGDEEQQEYNSKEEAISRKAPRTCNKPFGCGKVFCDQCYLPGDALGHRR